MSYNGWANYETWLVRLEIFDGSSASDWLPRTRSRTYVADLADALRQYAVERVEEDGRGIAASLAEAFLSGVNWREIAQHMAHDEAKEEADEADEEGVLRTYHALYRFKFMPKTDEPLVMRFSADDSDHAREQMRDAQPEAQILWISPAETAEEAIRDFEEHNAP